MSDQTQIDASFIRHAMELAIKGRGAVEPNPMVGCVIVRQGRIIAEAFHERFGAPHAEMNALTACKEDPQGATVYVTLEPCCHVEKKTPPCAQKLIEAKVARVVVGCEDPNPAVHGQGAALMCNAGIEVIKGPWEASCKQLNAAFFSTVLLARPYVTLKWAQSADGKVAGAGGRRLQISGEASMRAVHALRGRCDVVLVGVNTLLRDDPLLTARLEKSARPLLRAVLDTDLRIPPDSQLVRTASQGKVVVFTSDDSHGGRRDHVRALAASEVEVCVLPRDESRLSLPALLQQLAARDATHVLVESGPTLARSFFASGLADRVWVFHSPQSIVDATAPSAAPIPDQFIPASTKLIGDDHLVEYLNNKSPAYFANNPSADFRLS